MFIVHLLVYKCYCKNNPVYPWLQLVEALKDGWWQHGTTSSMVYHRLFYIELIYSICFDVAIAYL